MIWPQSEAMYVALGVGKRLHTLSSHAALEEARGFSRGTLENKLYDYRFVAYYHNFELANLITGNMLSE